MLRWITLFSLLCGTSALLGFSNMVPAASSLNGLCLAIFAFSAVLLIGSFEAYETQAVLSDRDDR